MLTSPMRDAAGVSRVSHGYQAVRGLFCLTSGLGSANCGAWLHYQPLKADKIVICTILLISSDLI